MELILALTALASIVTLVVTAPLGRAASAGALAEDRRAELEAAKQAKYREIRDAQLDFKLGKVSVADHDATERELQSQAVAILRELDELS